MRPPVATLLAAALLAVTLPVPAALAAQADPGEPSVGLSPDGGRYTDSLEGPLFPEGLRWVPGDRRSASWWVRNESRDTARLAVEVPEDAVLPWWLAVSTRADDGWVPVAAGSAGVVGALGPGEERRVDLRVAMRFDAGNASEREAADLRLRVRLTESVPGTGPDGEDPGELGPTVPGAPGDEPGRDGLLPGTGSDLGLGLLLLALVAVGLGVTLLRRRAPDERTSTTTEPGDRPVPGPAPQEVAS